MLSRPRRRHDGAGERMLGVGLGGRRQRKHLVVAAATRCGHGRHIRFALGQGAGLVEQDGAYSPHAFQREPVLDQHAASGRALGGDGDHKRYRQPQRVRACDHQHGDRPDDRVGRHAEHAPHHGGDDGGAQREPEQPARGDIGQPLRPRRRVLGLGHQPLDACQRRVVADRGDLYPQPRIRRDGARDDMVAHAAAHRHGLACDHRLVDIRCAVDDLTVGGDAAPWAHDHHVAHPQLRRRDRDHLLAASVPSTFSASSGRRAASESSAELVCASDRISIQ